MSALIPETESRPAESSFFASYRNRKKVLVIKKFLWKIVMVNNKVVFNYNKASLGPDGLILFIGILCFLFSQWDTIERFSALAGPSPKRTTRQGRVQEL